jgi:hypothetical protein
MLKVNGKSNTKNFHLVIQNVHSSFHKVHFFVFGSSLQLKSSLIHCYFEVICPLCFGMLQKVELDEFQETLFTKFLNCGYEDQGYSLSITVPPSTWIRHYGMYYYLVKEFGYC